MRLHVRFRKDERVRHTVIGPRWHRYLWDRRIVCPEGHHLPNTFGVTEAGFVECRKWVDSERRPCGCWVFILSVRGGGNLVFQVSKQEREAMQKLSTPAEMLDYLGAFGNDA